MSICSHAGNFSIASLDRAGTLSWTNSSPNNIGTVERATQLPGRWAQLQNFYLTNSGGKLKLPRFPAPSYYRLSAVDISATDAGFTNFIRAYGILRTIAGNGAGGQDGVNYWQSAFEGGPATNASLSRPHFAMADAAGNIYIADKDSHSILQVTLDGLIHTVAGTHTPGFNGDGPAPALFLQLNSPNGEWVRDDGTVYILDTGNSRIRRLSTNGIMTTLFADDAGISGGRGLWVRDDEALVFYGAGSKVKKWTPTAGIAIANSKSFVEVGNFVPDGANNLLVTDRGANRVYRLYPSGARDPVAGNGTTAPVIDGAMGLDVGLYGVRGIWPVPNGAYLLGTHQGSQVLYLDANNIIHILVEGGPGHIHSGDGEYFYSDVPKISEVRSVTMDHRGNILITENDFGYVRMISFSRVTP